MATITIAAVDYDSFITEAEADEYLAADLKRAAPWAALVTPVPEQAIVTATRYLVGLNWIEVPSYDTPPQAVKDATALLAADIASNPNLGDDSSTGSNVNRVKAGTAEVEFFRPVPGATLPSYLMRLLSSLLVGDLTWGEGGTAYGSDDCQVSRFDQTDYHLARGYS